MCCLVCHADIILKGDVEEYLKLGKFLQPLFCKFKRKIKFNFFIDQLFVEPKGMVSNTMQPFFLNRPLL